MEPGDKYLEVTYGAKPFTDYPYLLSQNLQTRFSLSAGSKLLDLGCGRGESAQAFQELGMVVTGVDQAAPTVPRATFEFIGGDLSQGLPQFSDDQFDIVFSKSVLEHFYYPDKILAEAVRVLRPGGLIISMTPSWRHNYKMFFDDFTHRTPFTKASLSDLHQVFGLEEITTEYFIQLPKTWKFPVLSISARILGQLVPDELKLTKTLRFSKEVMLLAAGRKPA